MDTSETYIKMCEKAEEIQEEWQPETADFYCYACKVCTIRDYQDDQIKTSGDTWLPRQDQLQEMVLPQYKGLTMPNALIVDFEYFVERYQRKPVRFTSMEQLWLTFVMKEKYNKVWSGEDWVAIKVLE